MFRTTATLLLLGFNVACAAQSASLQEYINIQNQGLGFNGTVLILIPMKLTGAINNLEVEVRGKKHDFIKKQ